MEQNEYSALLAIIVPQVVQLIVQNYDVGDVEATELLYQSRTYELLEDEVTKLWHLSPLTLFNMLDEEQKTGEIVFPEEA